MMVVVMEVVMPLVCGAGRLAVLAPAATLTQPPSHLTEYDQMQLWIPLSSAESRMRETEIGSRFFQASRRNVCSAVQRVLHG